MRYTDILQTCSFTLRRPFSVSVNSTQVGLFEITVKDQITLQHSSERRMTTWLPKQLFATENLAKSNTNRNHLAAS